jgi:hypothetical protein
MPFLLSLKVGTRLTAPALMIATFIPGELQSSCRPFAWPANSTFGSYRSYQCMGQPAPTSDAKNIQADLMPTFHSPPQLHCSER